MHCQSATLSLSTFSAVDQPGFGEGPNPEDRATGVPYRYLADPHSATHRTLTGEVSPQFHWRLGWSRSECITVTQLRTGHSLLLASYLHWIGRQQSPLCQHCGGDDETAQRLLLCCPAHMQARTSTNYTDSTDPRRMMNFLEMIGPVTRPPFPPPSPWPGMRERGLSSTVSSNPVDGLSCLIAQRTLLRDHYTDDTLANDILYLRDF